MTREGKIGKQMLKDKGLTQQPSQEIEEGGTKQKRVKGKEEKKENLA